MPRIVAYGYSTGIIGSRSRVVMFGSIVLGLMVVWGVAGIWLITSAALRREGRR